MSLRCFFFKRCLCAPNFFGIHCKDRSNDCGSGTSQELCGHGVCLNHDRSGFTCICEQVESSNIFYSFWNVWLASFFWCAPFGYLHLCFQRNKRFDYSTFSTWRRQGLNPQHLNCESFALTTRPCLLPSSFYCCSNSH